MGRPKPPDLDSLLSLLEIPLADPRVELIPFKRGTYPCAVVLAPRSLGAALIERFGESQLKGKLYDAATAKTGTYSPGLAGSRKSKQDAPPLVQTVDCRRIELLSSFSRSSESGVNLDRLPVDGTNMGFLAWLDKHKLTEGRDDPKKLLLLQAGFEVARFHRFNLVPWEPFPVPITHNQLAGRRYVLRLDKAYAGSPANLHVLLYTDGQVRPTFVLNESALRPTAAERKPGMFLVGSPDLRVRFYRAINGPELQLEAWGCNYSKELVSLIKQALVECGHSDV